MFCFLLCLRHSRTRVCLRQINFVGEDGVDAGGVFREGMSRMVEDLFSPDFDLLVPCPNGRHAVGQVGGSALLREKEQILPFER